MQYLLLFLEGVITFVSPCLLPMLPIYVSYFAAGQADRKKTLANALGFVLGFTVVFVAMGAFAGTVGRLVVRYTSALNIIGGLIVILFGLQYLGVLQIGFLNRFGARGMSVDSLGFFSSVLFGAIFSVGWTPCVGAFLGSALVMASLGGSVWKGIAMLLAYSLGLGIPFVASALLLNRLKGAFDFIKRNYKIVNAVSGGLLVAVGILMATGVMGRWIALLSM